MNEEIFAFMDERAPVCGKCKKVTQCRAVRFGAYSDIIGIYGGCCGKANYIYQGLNAHDKKAFIKIFGKEDFEKVKKAQSAALAAEVICEKCGKRRRYLETAFDREGKLLHRFDCRESKCKDFERSVWLELTKEDEQKIFEKAKEDARCRICQKTECPKIHCPKYGGVICEEHCAKCPDRDERTSKFICKF